MFPRTCSEWQQVALWPLTSLSFLDLKVGHTVKERCLGSYDSDSAFVLSWWVFMQPAEVCHSLPLSQGGSGPQG